MIDGSLAHSQKLVNYLSFVVMSAYIVTLYEKPTKISTNDSCTTV